MALAITAYGNKVLREKCEMINSDYPKLKELIGSMWETLDEASGVGLAAPQVNKKIKLFVVDTIPVFEGMDEEDRAEYFEDDHGIKEVFINAEITGESEEYWDESEGCLSLPDLSGDVERPWAIEMTYLDASFKKHTKTFTGMTGRVIQHEYDHTQGVLYIDHIKGINKRLMKGKLNKILEGKVSPKYRIRFAK